jgi:hypothetical protein
MDHAVDTHAMDIADGHRRATRIPLWPLHIGGSRTEVAVCNQFCVLAISALPGGGRVRHRCGVTPCKVAGDFVIDGCRVIAHRGDVDGMCRLSDRNSIRLSYRRSTPEILARHTAISRLEKATTTQPTYSHSALPITDELKQEISDVLNGISESRYEEREELGRRSLAVAVEHQGQGNALLTRLAIIFIKGGHSVQYLTASRHPIEFVEQLKAELGDSWRSRAKQVVVIDAYTPHFGFIDSIYPIRTAELQKLGVTYIRSRRTYAGMHTASSKAFNEIKAKLKHDERHPTLVIYEDCYALSDLESPEQYRIFVRHVLPSERMWDGMFSTFIESAIPESDWRTLCAYVSMKLDLRKSHLPGASEGSKIVVEK